MTLIRFQFHCIQESEIVNLLRDALQTLVMSDRYFLTLASIMLYDFIFLRPSRLESCVMDIKSHSSNLEALWRAAHRIWSIIMVEKVKNVATESIDQRKKGMIIV